MLKHRQLKKASQTLKGRPEYLVMKIDKRFNFNIKRHVCSFIFLVQRERNTQIEYIVCKNKENSAGTG